MAEGGAARAAEQGRKPAAAAGCPGSRFWGAVAAGLVLDQATKLIIFAGVEAGSSVAVIPGFFYLTPVRNPGMAWGLGQRLGAVAPALLALVTAGVIAVVVYLRAKAKVPSGRTWFDAALALILAGALGNLIDRIRPPFRVMDFLDFRIFGWHYPTFNVADIYIVAGVGVYLYWAWRTGKEAPEGGSRG
jgi:signal peptidase II